MKKILIILFLVSLIFVSANYGQTNEPSCATTGNEQQINLNQTGGVYLTSSGILKVLVIFAQFRDDNTSNPDWPSGSPPNFMHGYIDSTVNEGSTNYVNLTNYFNQMSMGTFHVIGKAFYVETAHDMSYYGNPPNRYSATKDLLQDTVDQLVNYNDYDNWTNWRSTANNYQFSNQPDGIVDMVVVVWRSQYFSNSWSGDASLDGGVSYTVENGQDTILTSYPRGSGVTVQDWYLRSPEWNFHSPVHEIGHYLLGTSHPYQDNGGDQHAFWGIMEHNSDGICANTYERKRLGWISPVDITGNISNATLNDFITTGVAYEYHPSNGAANEYYYFENHQKISIYDDATQNSTDKGIFVLQQKDNYNSTNNIKCRPASGDWNWQNPFYTSACYSQSLPAFKIISTNRFGLNIRDFLLTTNNDYVAVFALADNNNYVSCNGYEYGLGFNGSFNPSNDRVFAPWTNPSTHTWDNQETNFQMQVVSQNGSNINVNFNLGNMVITENTTLTADTYTFTGNLTVNSGVTLTIQPNATLNFNNGSYLIVNGTLNAIGASNNRRITFDFVNKSSSGINFRYGSGGTLIFCNIKNGNDGISINTGNANPSIQYCNISNNNYGIYFQLDAHNYVSSVSYNTIENNSYDGIYMDYGGQPQNINNNTIQYNGRYGIYCNGYNDPDISFNNILNNSNAGIYLSEYSTPDIHDNNSISYNAVGIKCYDSQTSIYRNGIEGNSTGIFGTNSSNVNISDILLDNGATGLKADYSSTVYANLSSIYGYADAGDYAIYADHSSTINAPNNCWDTVPPSIYSANGSTVSWQPGYACGLNKISSSAESSSGLSNEMVSAANNSSYGNDLGLAFQYIMDKKYENAIAIYNKKFKEENDLSQKEYILNQLAFCYKKAGRNDFINFLNKEVRVNLSTQEELYALTVELENSFLMIGRNYDKVLKNLDFLKSNFSSNDEVYKNSLVALIHLNLGYKKDVSLANSYLDELKAKYPNDELTVNAEILLGESNGKVNKSMSKEVVGNKVPDKYELFDNYPNPFNPSTVIKYLLPKNGFVTLRIYDMLGREVATLVNNYEPAGTYNVTFDASNLASGVYIYRLSSGDFVASKKLLLMK